MAAVFHLLAQALGVFAIAMLFAIVLTFGMSYARVQPAMSVVADRIEQALTRPPQRGFADVRWVDVVGTSKAPTNTQASHWKAKGTDTHPGDHSRTSRSKGKHRFRELDKGRWRSARQREDARWVDLNHPASRDPARPSSQ